MMTPMAGHYNVGAFSGIRDRYSSSDSDASASSYSMALRLVAARGGYETVVVYWGVLETAREDLATKAASEVPIVGGAIPDEIQRMPNRLKFALIDVKSGQWEIYLPDALDDESPSGRYTRVAADQVNIPLQCEFLAARQLALLLKTIDRVKARLNRNLHVAGILPTMYDSRTVHATHHQQTTIPLGLTA